VKITSFFTTSTLKLLLEFDNREYRLLDIKKFLLNDKGKLVELCDIDMFQSAMLDRKAGTVVWKNGVDFEPELLFTKSTSIDHIIENAEHRKLTMRDTEKYEIGYSEGFESGYVRAFELAIEIDSF
jgi:hypothetical protein